MVWNANNLCNVKIVVWSTAMKHEVLKYVGEDLFLFLMRYVIGLNHKWIIDDE